MRTPGPCRFPSRGRAWLDQARQAPNQGLAGLQRHAAADCKVTSQCKGLEVNPQLQNLHMPWRQQLRIMNCETRLPSFDVLKLITVLVILSKLNIGMLMVIAKYT